MSSQNRTADGKFATMKEAMRADCKELIERKRNYAKQAIRSGDDWTALSCVRQMGELRRSFFSDFGEEVGV